MHHEREADLPEYLQSTGVRVNGVQYDTRRLEQNAPRHLDLLQTLNYPNEDLVGTDRAKRSSATLGSLPPAIPMRSVQSGSGTSGKMRSTPRTRACQLFHSADADRARQSW
jgi:hypothetical protein